MAGDGSVVGSPPAVRSVWLNHEVLEDRTAAVEYGFFRLIAKKDAKLYSDVRKERLHNRWEYLPLHCNPPEQYVLDWLDNPPSVREILPGLDDWPLSAYLRQSYGCTFLDTCAYDPENIKFKVTSSQKGGTDIKIGCTTIHVAKHCSVYHPAVQMVLFAEVTSDSFYCPHSMVHRGITDLIEKSCSDKCSNSVQPVYKAGWVAARGHSTKSHNGDAISHLRSEKVDHQTESINRGSLPVLFDVSITSETLTSKLPPSDETQEAGSMNTAGIVRKSVPLTCQHDDLGNSSCIQEPEGHHFSLKNPNTYAFPTAQLLTPCDGTSSSTSGLAVDSAGSVANYMQWHCGHEGEVNIQAQEQKEHQCKLKNPDTYALATTQAPTPGNGNWTPVLWLDSGAGHHAVGDASFLCNLRDPPAGKAVRVADGSRLSVTKIGDIQTVRFQIPDVYLVPGLQMNLISVRQLAKCKIFPIFFENHAELCQEGEQVGGAIVDNDIYRLYYLAAAAIRNAAPSTS